MKPVTFPSAVVPARGAAAASVTVPPAVQQLLARFPAVCSTGTGTWIKPKHGVEHAVETTGRPVTAKPRRLDPAKRAVAEKEFRELEAAGIVRRSNSPWSSPLHMVPKPNGKWRPCGDYRRLNMQTVPDSYPLPNIQDFSNKLHGAVIFSKIDLVKGYHQVPVAQDSVQKTAITTPFGMFEYL
jgi:Reverse transcriptase (RNA-dependent DNA polymerase)